MTIDSLKFSVAIAAVVSVAVAAESCSDSSSGNPIEFETRVDSIGYMMPNVGGDTVYTAAKYSVVWPEKIGEDNFDALRDSLLIFTFGDRSAKNFDEATKQFMLDGVNLLRTDGDSTFTYVKVPYDTAYNADNKNYSFVVSDVTMLTAKLLVVQVYNYQYYYGSAHGMQSARYLNYSIPDGHLLTADNMFKPGNQKAILDLINAKARKVYPAEGTLFDEPIRTLGAVQIEEDDITFVYQPYEVAPYSTGIVRIPISRFDLQRFLTPEVIETLSQNE